MNSQERKLKIKESHKKYVDWWLPIDLECDSCLAPMSFHRFCETLLIYDDNWWKRWEDNFTKKDVLVLLKKHWAFIE